MKMKRNLSISLAATIAALAAVAGLVRPAQADLTGPKPPKRSAVSTAPSLVEKAQAFSVATAKH